MALAVDASTPALVTAADDPWTSASFTPPNDSLLVVKVLADWFTSGTPLIAVTSTGLTFERIGRIGAASQGLTEIWIAKVGSNGGSARTVSATTTITDDSGGIKVEVWTGFNTADPIDAFVCQANDTTNSISPACVTTTDNAWLTGGGVDWQNLGAATSSDTHEHGEPGGVAILSVRKSAATSPAGSATLNFDASGTGTPLWTWAILALRADTADPSPIYKVADRGSAQNLTGETSTAVDLPAAGSITVDNYLIARVALDNTGSGGAATTLSVSDSRNGSWTVTAAGNADPGAASAGSTCYIAYVKAANAYTNGDDVTFTYGNSTTAKSIIIEEWFGIHKTTPVAVAATTTSGATATGSIARTPTAAGQLVYGALSYEGVAADQITSDPDQTDGSWLLTNQLSTTSGTAASNQTIVGIYKRVTGTSAQTWNIALPGARDWGAVMLVFDAEPAGGATANLDQATETDSSQSVAFTKVATLSQANQDDTALAPTIAKVAPLSLAAETEQANSLILAKTVPLGLATEAETAFSIAATKAVVLGVATETDEAFTVSTSSGTTADLDLAIETDTSVSAGFAKTVTLGIATESDQAFEVAAESDANTVLGLASEADTSPALLASKTVVLGRATETSTAQPLTVARANLLSLAIEANSTAALTFIKVISLGVAAEVDAALGVLTGDQVGTAHAATGPVPTASAAAGLGPSASHASMSVPTATGA